ncbi:MAG: ABC transporter ATP-binding protein/permease [Rhodobacteraceae bacterium]|nr:ABC transporter ATP-binding protein/permease [Paracoccaceae bacterium]
MTPPGLFDGRRRALFAALVALAVAQAAALAAAAIATRAAFGALHSGADLPTGPISVLCVAMLSAAATQFGFRSLAEELGQDYAKDIRLKLFEHASRSAQSDLDRRRQGFHILRFTGDLAALKDWPGLGLPLLVQAAILLPAATAVLVYLNPSYGWVGLGMTVPSVLCLILSHGTLFQAHRTLRRKRADLAADMTERLPIAPRLAALGRRRTELRQLERSATRVAAAAQRRRQVSELLVAIPDVSTAIAASLIIAIGSLEGLPAATVAAALAALALTARPLRNIMSSSNRAAGFSAAHSKLKAALQRPTAEGCQRHVRLKKGPLSVEIAPPTGPAIRVDPGGAAVLPKAMIDDVAAVLTGTSANSDYAVRLNGEDACTLTPGTLRRLVGTVTDSPLLLKGSLRRALTLGLSRRPTDEELHHTAETAGLNGAIESLGGLDLRIAERGRNLTFEDRVMISLLRICLQKPGLILVTCPVPHPPEGVFWEEATKLFEDSVHRTP